MICKKKKKYLWTENGLEYGYDYRFHKTHIVFFFFFVHTINHNNGTLMKPFSRKCWRVFIIVAWLRMSHLFLPHFKKSFTKFSIPIAYAVQIIANDHFHNTIAFFRLLHILYQGSGPFIRVLHLHSNILITLLPPCGHNMRIKEQANKV